MHILYIGRSCPLATANKILVSSGKNPGFQIIKFTQLLLNGFCMHGETVDVLSNVSISSNKYINASAKEEDNHISYTYSPIISIPLISQCISYLYAFFHTLSWANRTTEKKIVFCDVLASFSTNLGSIHAAKICKIPVSGMITDMIGFNVVRSKYNHFSWKFIFFTIREIVQKRYLKLFTCFLFLTKYMNDAYNIDRKPHIIIEGSVDYSFKPQQSNRLPSPKIIMYAGTIEEQYGFDAFVKAFMTIEQPDIELHIYGNGKFVDTLLEYQKKDSRIKYNGVVNNEQIVAAEINATLLVNPRFSNQEFVKYSFPSKTSEYMLSGTPLLTTRLCGIPEEYFEYLYTFDEESEDGFANKLQEILSKTTNELDQKGKSAQSFVLKHKNNFVQSKKIIDFFYSLFNNKYL